MRLLLRGHAPRWLTPALVVAAALGTFILTAGPIRLAGANPGSAYDFYLLRPLSSTYTFLEVLLAATPLLFTGLAVLLAFRAGFYNIGAEGQFIAGAIAAAVVATGLPDLPPPLALPLGLGVGVVAGSLWGLVPALLRVRLGVDEVVTTLLLNPVALLLLQGLLNGPLRNPTTQFPESARIGSGYELAPILTGHRLHWGFVLAVLVALALWLVLSRTGIGLTLRAAGLNPRAAQFSGISVGRTLLGAALSSAGLAGLGGAVQVMGLQRRLTGEVSTGFGYTGIVVATLAALSVPAAIAVATLLADIVVGAEMANRVLQLPPQMGRVVTATLLLSAVSLMLLRRYRVTFPALRRRRARAPSSAGDPS
ncbi:ABC transporter permease [Intrasporangium calvum]|uniref:ABC transporter permease n=1 Tax=Intrasporangium calvum TaxID=53358 RepID=A0ABT5GFE2_9MICO|nr:ABC transporter permease [Intrasporangium calvum]MDC5696550.1 ABC transporter permease [Intrasporangium calvum]